MHWFFKLSLIAFCVFLLWALVGEAMPRLLPAEQVADRDIHGVILKDEVWSGTIRIVGDLVATPGVVITAKPGTRIIVFRDGDRFNFDYLPWHLRSGLNTGPEYHGVKNGELFWDESQKIQVHLGKFVALGTKEQPIVLTSNVTGNVATPFDFNVFAFSSGILSNVVASNYRRMEIGSDVTVRDSSFSHTGDCALCIDHGSPTIINSSFSDGVREYIWDFGGSPKIMDNAFSSSKGEGIVVDPDYDGAPLISHNDFEMPQNMATEFLTGDEKVGGVISYNNIVGGSQIKIPCDSKEQILENNIQGLISFPVGSCKHTITLGANYWGSTDPKTVLGAHILKGDSNLTVLIPSVLSSPPQGAGIRH